MESSYYYEKHSKTCDETDFWGQVKRTVNGNPVDQQQIDMIVNTVINCLELSKDDVLLDLCCGNGALTKYFMDVCTYGTGVDISKHLIIVANKYFANENFEFIENDVLNFVKTALNTQKYTKAVAYGGFQYLSVDAAKECLSCLNERFTNLKKFFIGNLPDAAQQNFFYSKRNSTPHNLDDHTSPLGVWRTMNEFQDMAMSKGWDIEFNHMPENFYGSSYRYDVVLTKNNR